MLVNHLTKKNYSPFLLFGFNCLKSTEPLEGDSLFFSIKCPGVSGNYLIDCRRMKG